MSDNRVQFLSDVLSVDAWTDPIKLDDRTAGVYVDLTFHEGRIGGDRHEIPFTFKLNIKRALLTVHLDDDLKMDRQKVARSVPSNQAEYQRVKGARDVAEQNSSLGGKIDISALSFALEGERTSRSSLTREDELRIVQTIPENLVTPKTEGAQGYSWIIEPTYREFLRGQPWHPTDDPRLMIGLKRLVNERPQVRIEIKCAFEDLDISDLRPKKVPKEDFFKVVFHEINQRSAEHFLKMILTESHLLPGRLDNRFREVVIANVIALES